MDISINWLNDLLVKPLPFPKTQNVEKFLIFYGLNPNYLTLNGFEVEGITKEITPINKDLILNIDVTPNRRDVNSMVGICEELEVLLNLKFKPKLFYKSNQKPKLTNFQLTQSHKPQYHYFVTFQVHNLEPKNSPQWLQKRLQSHGIHPINNIIDIIKYIEIEWGQPIQLYDIKKLKDFNLKLKRLETEETIFIGKNKTQVPKNCLVLGNNDEILEVSGIQTNDFLQPDDSTSSLILEFTNYKRTEIRKNVVISNQRTEKSKFFERGLNFNTIPIAVQRTLKLITLLHPKSYFKAGPSETFNINKPKTILLNLNNLNSILGIGIRDKKLTPAKVITSLKRLRFSFNEMENKQIEVQVPYNRVIDIEEEIDIIEEIGRIQGFNNFQSKLPYLKKIGKITNEQKTINQIKEYLVYHGFYELMSYSFNGETRNPNYEILNPLGIGRYLQKSLTSTLFETIKYNIKQQNKITRGFEIARVFQTKNNELNQEFSFLAGFISNDTKQIDWKTSNVTLAWYQLKELLINILSDFSRKDINFIPITNQNTKIFHPNRRALIFIKNKNIGIGAQINPIYANQEGIPTETFTFELNLTLLSHLKTKKYSTKYKNFTTLPSITRDISITIPSTVSAEICSQHLNLLINENQHYVQNVLLKNNYEFVQENKKFRTLTYSLKFQSAQRTLTNLEIDDWIMNLTKKLMINPPQQS